MNCDLHVHSIHSGPLAAPLLRHFCNESYSEPQVVYETLKLRGMDLVTLTDHDSFEGAAALLGRADFFASEEVTCRMPSGTEIHVGVYDITERQHTEIQRRRNDLVSMLIYLTEKRLFFSINHLFSSLTGRRALEDFEWMENYFPAVETLNSTMLEDANGESARFAAANRKAPVGGSDAHTLSSLGMAYTNVPGARSKQEFLEGLRAGRGRAHGASGSYRRLCRDMIEVSVGVLRDKPWALPLAPLILALPLVTLGHLLNEALFLHRWSRRVARKHYQVPRITSVQREIPAEEAPA